MQIKKNKILLPTLLPIALSIMLIGCGSKDEEKVAESKPAVVATQGATLSQEAVAPVNNLVAGQPTPPSGEVSGVNISKTDIKGVESQKYINIDNMPISKDTAAGMMHQAILGGDLERVKYLYDSGVRFDMTQDKFCAFNKNLYESINKAGFGSGAKELSFNNELAMPDFTKKVAEGYYNYEHLIPTGCQNIYIVDALNSLFSKHFNPEYDDGWHLATPEDWDVYYGAASLNKAWQQYGVEQYRQKIISSGQNLTSDDMLKLKMGEGKYAPMKKEWEEGLKSEMLKKYTDAKQVYDFVIDKMPVQDFSLFIKVVFGDNNNTKSRISELPFSIKMDMLRKYSKWQNLPDNQKYSPEYLKFKERYAQAREQLIQENPKYDTLTGVSAGAFKSNLSLKQDSPGEVLMGVAGSIIGDIGANVLKSQKENYQNFGEDYLAQQEGYKVDPRSPIAPFSRYKETITKNPMSTPECKAFANSISFKPVSIIDVEKLSSNNINYTIGGFNYATQQNMIDLKCVGGNIPSPSYGEKQAKVDYAGTTVYVFPNPQTDKYLYKASNNLKLLNYMLDNKMFNINAQNWLGITLLHSTVDICDRGTMSPGYSDCVNTTKQPVVVNPAMVIDGGAEDQDRIKAILAKYLMEKGADPRVLDSGKGTIITDRKPVTSADIPFLIVQNRLKPAKDAKERQGLFTNKNWKPQPLSKPNGENGNI